jgi:hypothetical protein
VSTRSTGQAEGETIMDVVQKVKDLSNLAFDERTTVDERLQAAIPALRLVERYLLPKKPINVAADLVAKILNPDFTEEVANRVEKIAGNVDRGLAAATRGALSVKRVFDHLSQGGGEGGGEAVPSRGKKRRYSR